MSHKYTVREFIRLTPPQKERLQRRDLEQYNALKAQMERDFSKESDLVASQDIALRK